MLGQFFKPPANAVSPNRVAASCCLAPMHANLKQEREAKVWHLSTTGNIANLTLQNTVVPPPKPSQVTVEVKAVGMNFADVFTCLGLYQAAPNTNVVPGLEIADSTDDSSPHQQTTSATESSQGIATPQLQVGDHVLGACRFGSYTTCLNVPAQQLLKMPSGWSFTQGAAFLVQSLTAYYGLRSLGNLQAGYCVLVHSAAGGCGLNALAISLAVGAIPIGTVSSQDKVQTILDRFPALNARQIFVRDPSCYPQQLQSALDSVDKDGFDIVLDAIAGEYFQPSYQAMARGGRHVILGAANWTPTGLDLSVGDKPGWLRLAWQYFRRPILDPTSMIGDNKSVMAFNLIWMFDKVAELAKLAKELQELELPPPHVGEVFDFDDAPSALRKLQTGRTVGKVVLEVTYDS